MATATRRRLRPFTVDHFRAYTSRLVYDDGERRELEDWQLAFARDVFARYRGAARYKATWLVVPEGNGKTTLIAELALYGADYSPTPWIPIGASSRRQAQITYSQAKGFVEATPGMGRRFSCHDGLRKIKSLRNGGEGIEVYASSDGTGDGVIPYPYSLLDELHRQRDLRLYRLWKGKGRKRGAQILVISTAGEPGSEFEDARERLLKRGRRKTAASGCFIRAAAGGTVVHDWAVRDRRQCNDMKVVARANPRSDLTEEVLQAAHDDPEMTPEHFQRFVCNLATRISGQAILPEEFDHLVERGVQPDPTAKLTLGWLDLGWKIDTTALGIFAWESQERRVVAGAKIIAPPVDEGDIVAGLLERQERYEPIGWVYDPNSGGRQMAQQLEKGTHALQTDDEQRIAYGLEPLNGRELEPLIFIEHTQDNAPMAVAATRLDETIRKAWLVVEEDPELRRHFLNAVKKSLGGGGEKWKYDRPPDARGERRRKYPIDALTGVLMANSIAVDQCEAAPAPTDLLDYSMQLV